MTFVQASPLAGTSVLKSLDRSRGTRSDGLDPPKQPGLSASDLDVTEARGKQGSQLFGGSKGSKFGRPSSGRGTASGVLQIQGQTQPKDAKRVREGLQAYQEDHETLTARAVELQQGPKDPDGAYRIAKKLDTAFQRLLTRVENRFVGGDERKAVLDALEKKQALSWKLYRMYDPDPVKGPLTKVEANQKSEPIPHARQFTGLTRFLAEPARVFQAIVALEKQVVVRAMDEGIKIRDAREAVLAEAEAAHGFQPLISLEDRTYSGKDWQAMLRKGALFRDVTFNDKARRGKPHAEDSHRLQWHLVMRDVVAYPEAYGVKVQATQDGIQLQAKGRAHQVADWFKATGHRASTKVESDDGESSSLWGHLFDSFTENFTSPEAFRRRHPFMSGIGRWV